MLTGEAGFERLNTNRRDRTLWLGLGLVVMMASSAGAQLSDVGLHDKPYNIDYRGNHQGYHVDTAASYIEVDIEPDPYNGVLIETRYGGEAWGSQFLLTYLDSADGIDRYQLDTHGFLDIVILHADGVGQESWDAGGFAIPFNASGIVYQSADTSQQVVMTGAIPMPEGLVGSLVRFERSGGEGCGPEGYCLGSMEVTSASDIMWRTTSSSSHVRLSTDVTYEWEQEAYLATGGHGNQRMVAASRGHIEGTAIAYTPEPSTALMMGLGLIGLAARKGGP